MALRSPFEKLVQPMLLKEQAQRCRDLAEKADPSTKERLLALAQKYDERYEAQTAKHAGQEVSGLPSTKVLPSTEVKQQDDRIKSIRTSEAVHGPTTNTGVTSNIITARQIGWYVRPGRSDQ
jgi:hypothetical protein